MNVFEKIREKLEERIEGNKKYTSTPLGNDARNQIIGLKKAIEIVNQVEQEHNNGWIACSERLPEVNNFVLVESEHGIWIASLRDYGTHKYFVDRDDDYSCSIDRVLAWQNLPQPYKERDTNGN